MSKKYEEHQDVDVKEISVGELFVSEELQDVDVKEIVVSEIVVDEEHQNVNLKGTLVSVFVVGIIIVVMWVVVYMMYVAR